MEDNYSQESLNIFKIWDLFYNHKLDIFIITTFITICGIIYSLSVTPMYRADVLIAPQQEISGSSQFDKNLFGGALQNIIPLDLTTSSSRVDQYLAILKSRDFLERFIRESESKRIIFSSKWNSERNQWFEEPSDFQTYDVFKKDILSINRIPKQEIWRLSIIWIEPKQAAIWANKIIEILNSQERNKIIENSKKSIAFIKQEKANNSIMSIQKSLDEMFLRQLADSVKANVFEDFAFKIIDPAITPQVKYYPNRTMMVILSSVSGLFLSFLWVILKNVIFNYRVYKASS